MQDAIWRRFLRLLGFDSSIEQANTADSPAAPRVDVSEARRGGWEVLPTNTNGRDTEFTSLGFEFGRTIQGDQLWRQARLPQGWRYDAAERRIVDESGAERVRILRKETSYDRFAYMYLVR